MHAFASDPEVTRHTEWGPNTPEDTAAFLREAMSEAGTRPRTRYALALVSRADEALIGSVELRITSSPIRTYRPLIQRQPTGDRPI